MQTHVLSDIKLILTQLFYLLSLEREREICCSTHLCIHGWLLYVCWPGIETAILECWRMLYPIELPSQGQNQFKIEDTAQVQTAIYVHCCVLVVLPWLLALWFWSGALLACFMLTCSVLYLYLHFICLYQQSGRFYFPRTHLLSTVLISDHGLSNWFFFLTQKKAPD